MHKSVFCPLAPIPMRRTGGRWPRWTGNGWQMVEDHRATPLWVAETGESYAIGSKIAARRR